jgi:uncharacterized repeat protein (TIGR01451 family)
MLVLSVADGAKAGQADFNSGTIVGNGVHSLWIIKTSDQESYANGDLVDFNITYGNDEKKLDFNKVVIEDDLPDSNYIEYLSASPQPSSINGNVLIWNIGKLGSGQTGMIQVFMQIQDNYPGITYKSGGFVSGDGFANIRQNLDTAQNYLTNIAKIYNNDPKHPELKELHTSSATIWLSDNVGTAVNIKGYGSGTYRREDQTRMLEKNKSIEVNTSLSETYHPTTLDLSRGRSLKFSSKWSESQKGINRLSGATLNEVYMYTNKIKRDSSIILDKNGSTLSSNTSFGGEGHIDVVKNEDTSSNTATPIYESHEDYLGEFNVSTNVDEYGSDIATNRSVTGAGMVASDKRISNIQRSYESGTGSYNVNDRMDALTNYMAKDMNVSYAPASYTYTPDVHVTLAKKWEEEMSSKSGTLSPEGTNSNSPASYISEEYSGADYLKKNTVAKGLNEMDTQAEFSGKAEFKVVKASNSNNDDEATMDDLYIGKYKILRNVTITGVAQYDQPHLTITKEGKEEPYHSSLLDYSHIDYKITVVNDGNQALEPVYVTDYFPEGTTYVSSSLRPTEIGSNYSRWSLTNLGIGSKSEIKLKLRVTGVGSLVNAVRTEGEYNNTWITAENYSALRRNWLSSNIPQLLAAKEGHVDSKHKTLVHYRIFLKNRLNDTMAIRVTDQLPAEMEFINSTTTPASYQPNQAVWNIINIKPGENVTIDYLARALQRGTFVNQAHIEASYRNGGATVETDITSSVDLGGGGSYSYSSAYSGWQPPPCFGLNCTNNQLSADEWIPCVSCGESEPTPIGGSLDNGCPSCVPSLDTGDDEIQ